MQLDNSYNVSFYSGISIHAPYKGCNTGTFDVFEGLTKFQSMHPIKDATVPHSSANLSNSISIHAPYKGCNDGSHECRAFA